MVNGRLESSSLDMYIAMEYGSDGDLFNLRRGAACRALRCLHGCQLRGGLHACTLPAPGAAAASG